MSNVGGLTFGGQLPPSPNNLSFIDSGSIDVGAQTFVGGLCVLEVQDETMGGFVIGAALVVVENDSLNGSAWAGILASSSRAAGPTPTFSIVGSAVHVSTSSATGHTIRVLGRRPIRIDYTAAR